MRTKRWRFWYFSQSIHYHKLPHIPVLSPPDHNRHRRVHHHVYCDASPEKSSKFIPTMHYDEVSRSRHGASTRDIFTKYWDHYNKVFKMLLYSIRSVCVGGEGVVQRINCGWITVLMSFGRFS